MSRKKVATTYVEGVEEDGVMTAVEKDKDVDESVEKVFAAFERDEVTEQARAELEGKYGLTLANIRYFHKIEDLGPAPEGKGYTPIRIEGTDALACLSHEPGYLGWWPEGPGKAFRAYVIVTDVKIHKEMIAEIRTKHSKEFREGRCEIMGKSGKPIRCPDIYSCNSCPFGRKREDQLPRIISLNKAMEDGMEFGTETDITMDEAISNIEAEQKLKKITKKNPRYVEELSLMERNKKVKDIAPMVGVTKDMVYKDIKKMNQIIVDWEES